LPDRALTLAAGGCIPCGGFAANTKERAMDVREAIQQAKNYVSDIFAEQHATDQRLEEVEFDDANDRWCITISFRRETESEDALQQMLSRQRVYKVACIDNASGRMLSIKHREFSA